MYLTKLVLNPRNRLASKCLVHPYELHRTLMKAFPDNIDADRNRLLFRIESQRNRTEAPIVLAQSSSLKPDWNNLPETFLIRPAETKEFDPDFVSEQTLGFRLTANPTKKYEGKRLPLVKEEEYFSWLERKGKLHGFTVLSSNAATFRIGEGKETAAQHRRKTSLPLFGVRFDGFLRVEDPEGLLSAVSSGIGSAKSFGFGLLSVARM